MPDAFYWKINLTSHGWRKVVINGLAPIELANYILFKFGVKTLLFHNNIKSKNLAEVALNGKIAVNARNVSRHFVEIFKLLNYILLFI